MNKRPHIILISDKNYKILMKKKINGDFKSVDYVISDLIANYKGAGFFD